MYKLYAMWGPPQDPDAFEEYYAATHVPLAAAVPGLRELNLVLTADGLGDAPSLYYRVAEMVFDSKDALEQAMQTREWDVLVADGGYMVETFQATLGNAGGRDVESPLP